MQQTEHLGIERLSDLQRGPVVIGTERAGDRVVGNTDPATGHLLDENRISPELPCSCLTIELNCSYEVLASS